MGNILGGSMKRDEKSYINTTVENGLLRSLRILAAEQGVKINALLEEAIRDLLEKYKKKDKAK